MLFSYEARDAGGQTVTGSLEAADERTAAAVVRDRGYYVMRLKATPVVQMQTVGASISPNGLTTASTNSYAAALQEQLTMPPDPPLAPSHGHEAPPPVYAAPENIAAQQYAINAAIAAQASEAQERVFIPPRMTTDRWFKNNVWRRLFTGVSLRDLAFFYRQFATLVGAGVPVRGALDAMSAQSSNATLRRVIHEMKPVIEAGGAISDAMSLSPWLFPDDHRALIVAGELSGGLDQVMYRISDTLEVELGFRNKLNGAVLEPLITFSMVFLLPPLFILVVQGNVVGYLMAAVLPIVLIAAAALGIWVAGRLSHGVKSITDAVAANFPGIGGTARMIALARFCRTLGALYKGGVNIPTAVYHAAVACGNRYLTGRLLMAVPYMEQGHGMLDALNATRVLPPVVLSMLGIGEMTGDVDVMMNKIADHFEQESVVRLHQTAVTIRVLATIVVGVIVCIELVRFYLGYYGQQMNMSDD